MTPENKKKVCFIMKIGKMLHSYGASSDRIEAALYLVSYKLKIKSHFFCVPTGLFGSFREMSGDEVEDEFTRLTRLEPGGVNLSKYYYVDKTIDLVVDGSISPQEGEKRLNQIEEAPLLYNKLLESISLSFIVACFVVILKGSLLDILVSVPLGFLSSLLIQSSKYTNYKRIHEVFTPFIMGMIIYGLSFFIKDINVKLLILSSIIYLVPGLDLTTSLNELASLNLTSGTGRFMGALMSLLKLSFGMYSASYMAPLIFNLPPNETHLATLHPLWLQVLSIVLISLSFVVVFQARIKDAYLIVLVSLLSYFSSFYFKQFFSDVFSPFLAGCVVALSCNIIARTLKRPTLILILPSIILLVPGTVGFQGLSFMHEQNYLNGIEVVFKAISIAASLVAGLFVGNVLIKPKRTL